MTSPNKTKRALYRKVGKQSLCRGKRIQQPNRCNKVKGCKIAKGKKRTYCRKKRATHYSKRVKPSRGRARRFRIGNELSKLVGGGIDDVTKMFSK